MTGTPEEEYNALVEMQLALTALLSLTGDGDPAVAAAAQEELDMLLPDPSEFTRIRNAAVNPGGTRVRVRATALLGGIVQRMLHG